MSKLQAAVLNALHYSAPLPRHALTAQVRDGEVTLLGVVERPQQKAYAEAVVRLVDGVTAVTNKISVRGETVH